MNKITIFLVLLFCVALSVPLQGVAQDISNPTFVGSNSNIGINERSVQMSADGSKWFVLEFSNSNSPIKEYALSTNFDISTKAVAATSTALTGVSYAFGFQFNNDGTKLFLASQGSNGDETFVREYSLGTPYTISTMEGAPTRTATISGFNYLNEIFFNSDGTKMYLSDGSNKIRQYTLGSAYDLTSVTYDNKEITVRGIGEHISNDGSRIISVYQGWIYQYYLSTNNDISTVGNSAKFDAGAAGTSNSLEGVAFNNAGTKMYLIDPSKSYEFNLAVYDATFITANHSNSNVTVAANGALPQIRVCCASSFYCNDGLSE